MPLVGIYQLYILKSFIETPWNNCYVAQTFRHVQGKWFYLSLKVDKVIGGVYHREKFLATVDNRSYLNNLAGFRCVGCFFNDFSQTASGRESKCQVYFRCVVRPARITLLIKERQFTGFQKRLFLILASKLTGKYSREYKEYISKSHRKNNGEETLMCKASLHILMIDLYGTTSYHLLRREPTQIERFTILEVGNKSMTVRPRQPDAVRRWT